MIPEQENNSNWLDQLRELIRSKQEESQALMKVQESLKSRGKSKDNTGTPGRDGEDEQPLPDENQPDTN